MALIASGLWSSTAWPGPSTGLADWFKSNLIDPEDGKLDVSDYLASSRGFLPIPIVITEPAVHIWVSGKTIMFATLAP